MTVLSMNRATKKDLARYRKWGVVAFAIVCVGLALRSYLHRNDFYGFEPSTGFSNDDAKYPDPFAEEIIFPGVAGDELPVFDVSDPAAQPVQLELPAMSCSGPFVFKGEVRHDHPAFPGAIVEMSVERQQQDPNTNEWGWDTILLEGEATVEEDGRFIYRIEERPPSRPGQYRLTFVVKHVNPEIPLEEREKLPLDDVIITVAAAEGWVEFVP